MGQGGGHGASSSHEQKETGCFNLVGRIRLALVFFIPWGILWFGSMWLSSLQTRRICLALPGESKIPFVAWMLPLYLSLDVAVPLVVLLAPDLTVLRRIFRAMLLQTVVATIAYIAVPQTLCFEGHEQGGVWENLAEWTGTTNLGWHADAPSLHVSFACTLAWYLGHTWGFGPRRGVFGWVWVWAIGVAISTVLVHEHHVVDVVTGLVLGLFACGWESSRPNWGQLDP